MTSNQSDVSCCNVLPTALAAMHCHHTSVRRKHQRMRSSFGEHDSGILISEGGRAHIIPVERKAPKRVCVSFLTNPTTLSIPVHGACCPMKQFHKNCCTNIDIYGWFWLTQRLGMCVCCCHVVSRCPAIYCGPPVVIAETLRKSLASI